MSRTRRKYDMSNRAAKVEETRRRIAEATLELHRTQGVLATSWEQIAERAGVAVGTVYRHFPTLDELLPACGELGMEQLALPGDDDVAAAFAGARSRPQRIRRLVELLFGLYERGGDVLWAIRRDRAAVPRLQRDHELIERRLAAIAAAALEPLGVQGRERDAVRALTDFGAWAALHERGITGEEAVEVAVGAVSGVLARR